MLNKQEQFGENLRARELTKDMADGTTYFDENESRQGGSLIDEATGLPYNNEESMDALSPEKSLVNSDHSFKDILGEDLAEAWLKENDPEYGNHSKNWGK